MDLDRIKALTLAHFEKVLLALFVLLGGWLIYSGVQKPDFLQTQQPDRLAADATQVRNQIDDDHTDEVLKERRSDFDIVAQTRRGYRPVDESIYRWTNTWRSIDAASVVRRIDPVLPPATSIRVHGVVTPIATVARGEGEYPLAELDPADAVEQERPRAGRRRRGRAPAAAGPPDMATIMGMNGPPMGIGGPPVGMGGPSMSAAVRRVGDDADESGYQATAKDNRYPQPSAGIFICGTAVLPYKSIYRGFEKAFADTSDYNLGRDLPYFHDLEVQRADVTDRDVSDLKDADWTVVATRRDMLLLAANQWIGFAPEIVPDDYREPALTMVIPPVLLEDYTKYSTHPEIPRRSRAQIRGDESAAEAEAERNRAEDFSDATLAGPGRGGRGMAGPPLDMMGPPQGMDMAMMAGGMGMTRRSADPDPVEKKIIRFYDFFKRETGPYPGREYVYRIRYGVVDPNFPSEPLLQPKMGSLNPEAAARVMELVAAAEQTGERTREMYMRYSDWSQPGEPVALPPLPFGEAYAGEVKAPSDADMTIGGRRVVYRRDPHMANMVTTQFDLRYGARIPLTKDVRPGSLLSASAETADVIDPLTLEVRKLPPPEAGDEAVVEVANNQVVVAISGGEDLQVDRELTLPGRVLLMDADGNLTLGGDIEQQRRYRTYSFADER